MEIVKGEGFLAHYEKEDVCVIEEDRVEVLGVNY